MTAFIAISGDLGSGKSTISRAVANELGFERIGTGDVHRQIADELGMSTLELNHYSEDHVEVDERIDAILSGLAASGGPLVADSRLAWFLLPGAFKVHLVVEPTVGAQRVVGRGAPTVETYASPEEALTRIRQRRESERRRFAKLHGVDIARLRNYDLVIDTTHASPDLVATEIVERFRARQDRGEVPELLLAPTSVYPTEHVRALSGSLPSRTPVGAAPPITIGYARPHFFVVDGHRRLSAAIKAGTPLVVCSLAAEDGEPVVGGIQASAYFTAEVSASRLYDWEAVHGFRFVEYPVEASAAS